MGERLAVSLCKIVNYNLSRLTECHASTHTRTTLTRLYVLVGPARPRAAAALVVSPRHVGERRIGRVGEHRILLEHHGQVDELLERYDSVAAFTGESCSFVICGDLGALPSIAIMRRAVMSPPKLPLGTRGVITFATSILPGTRGVKRGVTGTSPKGSTSSGRAQTAAARASRHCGARR